MELKLPPKKPRRRIGLMEELVLFFLLRGGRFSLSTPLLAFRSWLRCRAEGRRMVVEEALVDVLLSLRVGSSKTESWREEVESELLKEVMVDAVLALLIMDSCLSEDGGEGNWWAVLPRKVRKEMLRCVRGRWGGAVLSSDWRGRSVSKDGDFSLRGTWGSGLDW